MSELADKAISGDRNSFNDFRKLTACGIALVTGGSGEEAATIADKSIFKKTVDYAVGKGELAADNAVESLIDRGGAHLTTMLHRTISHVVTAGCKAAGSLIGGIFGPKGGIIGRKIGEKVAGVLNTAITPLISKGVAKIKEVAKNVYQKVKAGIKSCVSKVINFFFG